MTCCVKRQNWLAAEIYSMKAHSIGPASAWRSEWFFIYPTVSQRAASLRRAHPSVSHVIDRREGALDCSPLQCPSAGGGQACSRPSRHRSPPISTYLFPRLCAPISQSPPCLRVSNRTNQIEAFSKRVALKELFRCLLVPRSSNTIVDAKYGSKRPSQQCPAAMFPIPSERGTH